jgi:hypothetical protein
MSGMSRLQRVSLVSVSAGFLAVGGCATSDIPDLHSRPIVEENGRTLLWASEDDEGRVEWFDMTDAEIDPATFQFGIGKDTIASIDEPRYATFDDPVVAERNITRETPVLGVSMEGVARAYPVDLMSMHEIVNDEIAGKPYAVMW